MPEHAETPETSTLDVNSGSSPFKAIGRKKTLACRRCHTRKVKCSGGKPCNTCRAAKCVDDCVYIGRDRQVKVAERYLQQVLAENYRLKHGIGSPDVPPVNTTNSQSEPDSTATDSTVLNPLMQDRAWFVPYDTSKSPIYIGEAACTAFATRVRQSLCVTDRFTPHFPRVNYVQDDSLVMASDTQVSWPAHAHARLLIKVVTARVNRAFHIFLIEPTVAKLDQIYRDSSFPRSGFTCKLFAIFALGEVYSSGAKHSSDDNMPGLSYFMYACSLIQILPERADLDQIEAIVLLSFYSHNLNRRNSAYSWIGSALRLGISLGLHHNLPNTVSIEPLDRQHRVCLWWTLYICDRIWGSKLGHPLIIQDTDISVDQPSTLGLNENERRQLPESGYINASIELARIAGNIIGSVYRRNNPPPLIQSVQKMLRDLKNWIATLPETIRLPEIGIPAARHIISLHLSFNQCVILATRPVLLYVLEKSQTVPSVQDASVRDNLAPIISTLADACLHAARHSNELLTQVWMEGTLATFGYFDAQYIFSSAVILAISSVLNENSKDNDLLESAAQLLQYMADSGNLPAIEFCGHLHHVKLACDEIRSKVADVSSSSTLPPESSQEPTNNQLNPLTTEMVFGQPIMQDFLTQAECSFDLPNVPGTLDDASLFYDWSIEL